MTVLSKNFSHIGKINSTHWFLCSCKIVFKGIVMQIEKALINDRLRVAKVS